MPFLPDQADGSPVRAYLFAHPAGHSLSPAMHDAALASLGIEGRYLALDVPPSGLRAALDELRRSGAWGANLTIPHKEAALPLLDDLSEEAWAIGAVNTVVRRDGRLHGLNTDAPGFMAALVEAGVAVGGRDALVLGAGGAGRAVAFALREAGARVGVWNRTPGRAEALASEFRLGHVSDARLPSAARSAWLLVNSTSVGLRDAEASPLLPGALPRDGWVCDIVYRPLETRLLREARAAGLGTVDGLGMLVHQGALALSAWAGRPAPADVMRYAALAALVGTQAR
ncbi:MAG TPA: shikimate dehydrogenase [Deinococcales bacterium]|nr:shikimate dehydrogenase [Deinococcales bacterium]